MSWPWTLALAALVTLLGAAADTTEYIPKQPSHTVFQWGPLTLERTNGTERVRTDDDSWQSLLAGARFRLDLPEDFPLRMESTQVSARKKKYALVYPILGLVKLFSMKLLMIALLLKVLGIKKLLLVGALLLPLVLKGKSCHQDYYQYQDYPQPYYGLTNTGSDAPYYYQPHGYQY